ncbi:MAG: response regulator [bacterium]|nr:response regulator [bacterium]
MTEADKSFAGKKVLIVEDDTFLHGLIANKMTELLEQGIEVFPVLDAKEALKTAHEVHPDLLLLDIALPDKNGFTFLEELRKEDAFKTMPVIVLSNLDSDEDHTRAKELGVTSYLVKADFPLSEISKEILKHL